MDEELLIWVGELEEEEIHCDDREEVQSSNDDDAI